MPSWISISLEIVCNPFKSQFVRYDSRSFMNTAKKKGRQIITKHVKQKGGKKIHKLYTIRVITKLPNSEQSYKGKVKTHK
jgi:hypothetical protein